MLLTIFTSAYSVRNKTIIHHIIIYNYFLNGGEPLSVLGIIGTRTPS